MDKHPARGCLALFLALLIFACPVLAAGELPWPEQLSQGQAELQFYIDRVNENLTAQGEGQVNSLFGCYPTLAILGITAEDNAETVEQVEMTFTLSQAHVLKLELRVSALERFPAIAAAVIQAASPTAFTLAEARRSPAAIAQRALQNPATSFGDTVDEGQGESLRAYYGYEPNPYHYPEGQEVNYLTLTLIYPFDGLISDGLQTPAPQVRDENSRLSNDDGDEEWVGYDSEDDYTHLEVFVSPTPEAFVPEL